MEAALVTTGGHETAEAEEIKEEEKSSSDKIENQAGLSDQLSNLVIDHDGAPNFIGSGHPEIVYSSRADTAV